LGEGQGKTGSRILGVDYGEKRVGVAVSDPLLLTAQGVGIVENLGPRKIAERISALAEEAGAGQIVVGLPRNMNGSLGKSALQVMEFAERLRKASGLEVVLWDERLSTIRAERGMLQADLSRAKRAKLRDKIAAQLVLQNYLDYLRAGKADTSGSMEAP